MQSTNFTAGYTMYNCVCDKKIYILLKPRSMECCSGVCPSVDFSYLLSPIAYVTLNHKTSHKGIFFIEIYTSSESYPLMYGLLG